MYYSLSITSLTGGRRLLSPLRRSLNPILRAGHTSTCRFSTGSGGRNTLLPIVLSSRNLVLRDIPGSLSDARKIVAATRTTDANTFADEELVVPFFLGRSDSTNSPPVGFLRPSVVQKLEMDHQSHLSHGRESPWELYSTSGTTDGISFSSKVREGDVHTRSRHINQFVERMKDEDAFQDLLRGWSNESFPVYEYRPDGRTPKHALAFTIERAALPLFGFPNFGCLLIAYHRDPSTGKYMSWIPRRSHTKKTWPSRLDVTVGGGLAAGDTAVDTIVRECSEEASLDVDFVRKNLRPSGVLPFPNRSPAGWLLPGLYYLFELPLPADGTVRPRVNEADGEVDNFELMDAETVMANLSAGVFKPSSALAILHFFIEHRILTKDTDPHFLEMISLLREESGIAALDEHPLLPH